MSGFPLFQTCKMNISSFKLFSWSHKIFLYCKTYSRSIFFRATSRIARFKKFKTDSTEIGINVQKSLNKKWNILTEQLLLYYYLQIKIYKSFSFDSGFCLVFDCIKLVCANYYNYYGLFLATITKIILWNLR